MRKQLLTPDERIAYNSAPPPTEMELKAYRRRFTASRNRDVMVISKRETTDDFPEADCDERGLSHAVCGRLLDGESLDDFILHYHRMRAVIAMRTKRGVLSKRAKENRKYRSTRKSG